MAYIGNQLSWLAGTLAGFGAAEGQNAIFFYANSTDSLATVLGANYISDGQKRGLQNLGNIVFFFDGTNVFPLVVTALQANASGYGVTLSQWEDTGAIGATNAAYHAATNTTSFTATAAQVTGGEAFVELDCTGAGSTGTVTMPTVAAIVAALGISEPGQSWVLRIKNTGYSGTITLAVDASAQFALTGTATIATTTWRDYLITLTSLTAGTIQNLGGGATL